MVWSIVVFALLLPLSFLVTGWPCRPVFYRKITNCYTDRIPMATNYVRIPIASLMENIAIVAEKNDAQSSSPSVQRECEECSNSAENDTPTGLSATWKEKIIVQEPLSNDICCHYLKYRQSETIYNTKMELTNRVYEIVKRRLFRQCGFFVVGGSMNGFGMATSDVDVCLMIATNEIDQRIHAVDILRDVKRVLSECNLWVGTQRLITAKVPILKVLFCGPKYDGIEMDLNANNSVAIRNTHLLYYYSRWEWKRTIPLVSVVKHWARRQGINDASKSTLSSYSLLLMVIHYLQHGAKPKVLPSLQELYPNFFNPRTDIRKLSIFEPLQPPPAEMFVTENTESVGQLLIGFLKYYAQEFDYTRQAISIRLGGAVSRETVMWNKSPYNTNPTLWQCLCIEEPFKQTNVAYSVYEEAAFTHVIQVFVKSYDVLSSTQRLSSILDEVLLPMKPTSTQTSVVPVKDADAL